MCWTTRGRHLVDYCWLMLCCYWSLVELFVFSDHASVCAFFGQCVYVTFAHQGVEMDELWPPLNAPTVCRTGCSRSSSPPAKLLCSPASLCVGVADSGSCVCSGGKNGIRKSVEMRGLNCSPDAEKGMIHWQPSLAHLTGTEAEAARRQEKHSDLERKEKKASFNSCTLTFRVLALEVPNEADVFFHPIEGSQLQSISYHLHGLLQQLGAVKKK